MDGRTVLLVVGLPLAPWAWRVFRELTAEIRAASDSRAPERTEAALPPASTARPTAAQRLPGFRAVGERAAVQVRWEGGFGRRNL